MVGQSVVKPGRTPANECGPVPDQLDVMSICTAVPPPESIGWLQTWRCWFGGYQPPPDAELWFMSVRWWGRTGKVLALIAGGTVLLDIIGPERLKGAADDPQEVWAVFKSFVISAIFIGVGVGVNRAMIEVRKAPLHEAIFPITAYSVLILAAALTVALAFRFILPIAVRIFIKIFANDRPGHSLRIASIYVLLVGFHFDLLAS